MTSIFAPASTPAQSIVDLSFFVLTITGIIFVVVAVILVTVLVQGISLPAVVRWARLPEDVARCNELQLARSVGAQAALQCRPREGARDRGRPGERAQRRDDRGQNAH